MTKTAQDAVNNADTDEVSRDVYQRFLDGKFLIFALTTKGTVQELASVSVYYDLQRNMQKNDKQSSMISFVDVAVYHSAEEYAEKNDMKVSYIEMATKPDGAD